MVPTIIGIGIIVLAQLPAVHRVRHLEAHRAQPPVAPLVQLPEAHPAVLPVQPLVERPHRARLTRSRNCGVLSFLILSPVPQHSSHSKLAETVHQASMPATTARMSTMR